MKQSPPEKPTRKKVVVLHTGGTIFMYRTERGLDTRELIIPVDKKNDVSDHIDFTVEDLFGKGGIDSSKMTLAQSRKLAERIVELQNDPTVHGVVVTHGTDTMAETALELSYALKNLHKPVVFTGAQIPSSEKTSDGPRNFFRSVYLAAHANKGFARVVICFGYRRGSSSPSASPNLVLDARNAEKSHMTDQAAFLHPDSKSLGSVSINGGVKVFGNTPVPTGPTTLHFGFSSLVKRAVIQRHSASLPWIASGLVVDTYGSGNAPDSVIAAMRRRVKFFPIVAASQARGNIDMTAYAAGRPALEAGVLPSGGLTPVSASKRLAYLVSHKREISKYARKRKVPYRALLNTLYLSGGKFNSKKIKEEHARILNVPIIGQDLLVQIPFRQALRHAVRELKGFTEPH